MVRISNAVINEEQIAAVVKGAVNHEIIFASGQRLTVSPADAAAVMDVLAPPPKK